MSRRVFQTRTQMQDPSEKITSIVDEIKRNPSKKDNLYDEIETLLKSYPIDKIKELFYNWGIPIDNLKTEDDYSDKLISWIEEFYDL